MRVGLGEFRGPHSIVGILGLMNCEVRRPDSVVNDSLSVIPLLEVVTSVFLVSRMNFGCKDHLVHELSLFETLIDQ